MSPPTVVPALLSQITPTVAWGREERFLMTNWLRRKESMQYRWMGWLILCVKAENIWLYYILYQGWPWKTVISETIPNGHSFWKCTWSSTLLWPGKSSKTMCLDHSCLSVWVTKAEKRPWPAEEPAEVREIWNGYQRKERKNVERQMAWDLNIHRLTESDEWLGWLAMDLEGERLEDHQQGICRAGSGGSRTHMCKGGDSVCENLCIVC